MIFIKADRSTALTTEEKQEIDSLKTFAPYTKAMIFEERRAIYIMIILFSFFDVSMTLLQGSSIRSLSWKNLSNLVSPINLLKKCIFFFSFWIFNIALLLTMIFFLENFCETFEISSRLSFLILLCCVLFRLHSITQMYTFFILGIFSPNTEFVELFFTGSQIEEYVGVNSQTLPRNKQILNNIIKVIRDYILDIGLSSKPFVETFFSKEDMALIVQRNKRVLSDVFDYVFRLLIPHAVTIIFNHKGMENPFLRILMYTIFGALRVFYLIKVILYLSGKVNLMS